MLIQTLKILFARDLARLKVEIGLYQDESKIWFIEPAVANSAGNLCMQLLGNLHTHVVVVLAKKTHYRQQPLSLSERNIPKAELIAKIDTTMQAINYSLGTMTNEDIKKEYPKLFFEKKTSTEFLLAHLSAQLTYHLGKISQHRRLSDGAV